MSDGNDVVTSVFCSLSIVPVSDSSLLPPKTRNDIHSAARQGLACRKYITLKMRRSNQLQNQKMPTMRLTCVHDDITTKVITIKSINPRIKNTINNSQLTI
jgi:hypothetical protein